MKECQNTFPIDKILNCLEKQDTFVFLENRLSDEQNRFSYIFTQPLDIISCFNPDKMRIALKKIQRAQKNGYYLSGFISYEAGYAFERVFRQKKQYAFPLLWMGVFKTPIIFDHRKNKFLNPCAKNFFKSAVEKQQAILPPEKKYELLNQRLNTGKKEYFKNINRIKHLIEKGDTYQVNYTLKYKFNFNGDTFAFYRRLRDAQPTSYTAFIRSRDWRIISFSPELFFRQDKQNIFVRPMKGTAKRDINPKAGLELKYDPKNRAENLMIVDLLRNDLGKISRAGSVKTTRLFTVEKYPTLFQMTSTIKSVLKKQAGPAQIFSGIFPSGSVTGAPKIRTMQIIKTLEKEDRKIYTGAIGFISPKNSALFNVAIRTILLEGNRGEMGLGSGITYDSDPDAEYRECLLKADFLTIPSFKLIETMRWTKKEGFSLLGPHLERLSNSAGFFDFPFQKARILRQLKKSVSALPEKNPHKIRLLLEKNGGICVETSPLEKTPPSADKKVIVSRLKTDPDNIFFYHKTTNRPLYEKEYGYYKQRGFYDILFFNKKNELTEGAISNIFIKKGRLFYTPPVGCGLLAGVFRKMLLSKYPGTFKEKILSRDDLKNADELYLANSVRGLVKVNLKNF